MKKIYVIFHLDGSLTLVEQTAKERVFTPIDSLSQLVSTLRKSNADIPEDHLITETPNRRWREQLDSLTAERVSA